MAARTSMFDIDRVDWSDQLLELFGVPRAALPRIVASRGRRVELRGAATLAAGVADQASGALAVLDFEGDDVLVNLGTGGFVLKPLAGTSVRLDGYLTAPCLGDEGSVERSVLEGTINGAGALLDRFGGPAELPERDATPDAFCLPDVAGLGSPYWRPDLGLCFSDAASGLDDEHRQRIATEGLLFRIRQLLDDIGAPGRPRRILLAGGVTRNPGICRGLAALLGRAVERLDGHQAGLMGAARLAAGLSPYASPATHPVTPGRTGAYLHSKYENWRSWVEELVRAPRR
jgi:glycerol kinase